jgi:hypothetical protein
MQVVNYWSKSKCNFVSGRDPSGLPLNIKKNETLKIFIGELCRTINLEFEGEILGPPDFQIYRFSPSENTLNSSKENLKLKI